MPGTTKTSTTGVVDSYYDEYFSKDLLDKIIPLLVLGQFGMKNPLPRNAGAKTIRMFRFGDPSTADVQSLTEGTPMSSTAYKQLSMSYKEATLAQYGQVISITDILSATSLFNMLEQANLQNAQDAALHCDTIIRNVLADSAASGGSHTTGKNVIYGGAATGWGTSITVMTSTEVLDAVTALKAKSAPRYGGYYIAAAPPQITRDLMADSASATTTWKDVAQYSAPDQYYTGEVGRMYGARFVETTNPWMTKESATADDEFIYDGSTGDVYSTFVFGQNAYGVPDLSGMSPMAPRVSVVQGPDKADPLNQTTLCGWKTYYAALYTQPKWMVQIQANTGYGA